MCTENYYWHHDYIRLAWDSGFTFNTHRAKTNYDWSIIGLLDIDKVIRDRDVAIIEKHLGTVLNYCLDEEQTKILEPTFVKVFQLSQLSMQYLQFCKRYLDNTVILLKKELARHKEENAKLKKNVEELKQEISDLTKKAKELKQTLQPTKPAPENFIPASYKCNVCYKIFVTEDCLVSHVKRRHEIDNNPFQTETDRLQLEIKELKERLNSTEKYIQSDNNTKSIQQKHEIIPNNDAIIENATHTDDLKNKFNHLKHYVEEELTVLRNEKRYQEKYEKWFEMVFERLDSSKNELQGKQEVVSKAGDGDKLIRKESSTQTFIETYVESETMTDDVVNVVSEESVIVKPIAVEIDVEKIQNDIRINTENHLDQMQGVLEKKLSGGFEQIQSQMNTFWKKLSDIELEKKQNTINHVRHTEKRIPNMVAGSNSVTKEDQNIQSSSDTSSSGIYVPKSAPVKNQPIPAPRIVKQFSMMKRNKPLEVKSHEKIISPMKKATIVKPIVTELEESSSEETSSSDGTVEIVKAPVKVTPIKNKEIPIKYPRTPKKDIVVEKENVVYIESEEEQEEEDLIKPATSASIKNQVSKWNREIEELVNSRLREIGISPYWKGIPEKSYQQAMRVMKHQTDLAKRKYPRYHRIREILVKIMNDRLNKQIKSSKGRIDDNKQVGNRKILVPKQSISKRHSKRHSKHHHHHHRQSKDSLDNASLVDIEREETRPKPKIRHIKESFKKENNQEQTNLPQDKITLVSVTPIKKKVLFDLEDSSRTFKTIQAKSDSIIPQRQDDKKPVRFERNIILSSPAKKDIKAVDTDIKGVMQKTHRTLTINDGGSSSSLVSSILETPKLKSGTIVEKKTDDMKDDLSDWDVSDILT